MSEKRNSVALWQNSCLTQVRLILGIFSHSRESRVHRDTFHIYIYIYVYSIDYSIVRGSAVVAFGLCGRHHGRDLLFGSVHTRPSVTVIVLRKAKCCGLRCTTLEPRGGWTSLVTFLCCRGLADKADDPKHSHFFVLRTCVPSRSRRSRGQGVPGARGPTHLNAHRPPQRADDGLA